MRIFGLSIADSWLRDADQSQDRTRQHHAQPETRLALRRVVLRRDRAPDSRAAPSRLEAELQEERRRSSRMKSVMQGAAAALRRALMVKSTQNIWSIWTRNSTIGAQLQLKLLVW